MGLDPVRRINGPKDRLAVVAERQRAAPAQMLLVLDGGGVLWRYNAPGNYFVQMLPASGRLLGGEGLPFVVTNMDTGSLIGDGLHMLNLATLDLRTDFHEPEDTNWEYAALDVDGSGRYMIVATNHRETRHYVVMVYDLHEQVWERLEAPALEDRTLAEQELIWTDAPRTLILHGFDGSQEGLALDWEKREMLIV
jgi:hypothetical protein